MYGLHKLLWDIRNVPEVAARFRSDRTGLIDEYGIDDPDRTALAELDFRSLFDRGVNPYLLYFCAIQLEVPRDEYYAQLREERSPR